MHNWELEQVQAEEQWLLECLINLPPQDPDRDDIRRQYYEKQAQLKDLIIER